MDTQFIEGWGGAQLAVHTAGEGRPVLLLHGLFSSAQMNWIKFGHAAKLAEAGFAVIMPDLRAHGQSEAPHDPQAYPADVLVKDVFAVVETLGLTDYDLCGFSLGARTAVKAVIAGLKPRRLVLGGMGLEGLTQWQGRTAHFLEAIARFGTIQPGDPLYMPQQFMKSMKVDREAMRLLLGSIEGSGMAALSGISMPTLVLCGSEDRDNGSPDALTAALPDAVHVEVPGTHMSCVTKPELGEAIARFLT
jgi:pimeloyl-ACP methyl ester carboxylesterase